MKLQFLNLRKKVFVGLILLILIASCSSFVSGYHKTTTPVFRCPSNGFNDLLYQFDSRCKAACFPYLVYDAQDIDLEDAAYHKSYGRNHVEWWYFEGIFDNGYSLMVSAMIFSKGCHGFCRLALHIYNDTELEFQLRKDVPMKEFEASEEFPFITVSGKQIMKLDREKYNNTGEWVYNVSLELEGQVAHLQFQGITNGYKGRILRGWYGLVLPKATVNGTLILNGEEINVTGLGYHEHAHGIHLPIWEYGWYWGKIASDSFNLFWVKMMQTRWIEQQRFAILSQDQSAYIQINPKNIKFKTTGYKFNTRRIIPTKFVLKINDPENDIYINVTMETINIHHMGGRINHYWRYHVRVNGQITYKSTTEIIKNQIQIMELVRFPSLIPIW